MVTLSLPKETKELSLVKVILEPLSLFNPGSPANLETRVNKSFNHLNLAKGTPVPLNQDNPVKPAVEWSVNHNNQTKATNSLRKSTLALHPAHLVALIHLEA